MNSVSPDLSSSPNSANLTITPHSTMPLVLAFFIDYSQQQPTISSTHNKDAYLTLSVTVLATLCRVPDIASSEDMNSNIPLMLEVMSMSSSSMPSSVLEECCEFLYFVLTASENGIMTFYEFSGIKILASRLRSLQDDDSRLVDMCIKLLQLIISRISLDKIQKDYLFELSIIVTAVARQFAILHNSLKFEALHVLNSVICSTDSLQLVNHSKIVVGHTIFVLVL
jgi:hypothetical protein